MKYCPNTECPFLDAVGRIAEYEDRIDVCPECGTELSAGAAPPLLSTPTQADSSDLQTVVTVNSEDEAIWIQDELDQMRMVAKIVELDPEDVDPELVIDPDTPLFDVQVLAHHVVPAMAVINTLLNDDEFDDDGFDDDEFDDDEFDDDEFDDDERGFGESDSSQVVGTGNNFLLIIMVAVVVLAVAALIYGFGGF